MNWGYKILVVYSLFIAGILFLVYKSSIQKMDLVTTDYYGKELKFQEQIDEIKRADALSENVQYEIKSNQLLIKFPKDFSGKKITGTAELYCPADENKDVKRNISLQDTLLTMPITSANKGLHELHILWSVDSVKYYFEKKIII
ncbi:MAG TPA: FixH family protein [Puia sp.]|nr:FixH family protein [Puia sp.]